MARAATTTDVFNAIAEPARREIVDLLAGCGPQAVGRLVNLLGLPQPAVSKHLGVLRAVGLVSVKRVGRSRVYQFEPRELKAVHDWTATFERFWTSQLRRLKEMAEKESRRRGADVTGG